ncbi:MAG: aminotransferase class V-fold PLP-dependent enzyme [bacterium]|nr:aminotransferase class V-fold PLP-dependent enzyme [bacterium]
MSVEQERRWIYLDSAATSLHRPPEVAEAVLSAMASVGNCGRGSGETALAGARVVYEARRLVDELFHGYGAEQTVFTMNATESLNIAIKGLLQSGDKVLTTVMEHNSVLRPLYEMEAAGVQVERIGCKGEENAVRMRGELDLEALLAAIRPDVKVVCVTHASNLTGNVNPLRLIGERCRKVGALFLVDASQTAGVFPIDMQRDCIDVLCFTGHKGLLGPQGTGGLCIRRGVHIRPLLSGGSGILTYSKTHPSVLPTALEAGTMNAHGLAGLAAGVRWILDRGVEVLRERELALAARFYEQVREIPQVKIYGNAEKLRRGNTGEIGQGQVAIVALNVGELDSGELSDWLMQEYGIVTRAGGHCAPLMHEALGTREQGAVRFSFSYWNQEEEIERAVQAVREIAQSEAGVEIDDETNNTTGSPRDCGK